MVMHNLVVSELPLAYPASGIRLAARCYTSTVFAGKRIVLGITGSVACYKAADLASKLTQAGALVDAILTPSATEFVTPLAIRSLTRRTVFVGMFADYPGLDEAHVELARSAEAVLIAPATADCMARLAHGRADDMLALTVLASTAPILVAPAMDSQMWLNVATQENSETLRRRGVIFCGPIEGRLASGRSGAGRMESTENILGSLSAVLGRSGDFAGIRLVVTAGGTQEPIDPVRYVGNRSSGKMGFAIAEAARDRGANVVLIAGATSIPDPAAVRRVRVATAAEMCSAVLAECGTGDALIMAAAVADYRPVNVAEQKIKKTSSEGLALKLEPTTDILQAVQDAGLEIVRVGFAAESENLERNAAEKLRRKGLSLIAANDITATDAGFGTDTNRVVLIGGDGRIDRLPLLSKYDVANRLLDRLVPLLCARR
jgi:phosphopantothenoylcysteine decarboxylase / phosphopantothenate---cysteine ligase